MMDPVWMWLLLAGVVLIVFFEFVAIARKRLTISQMIWRASAKYPFIPFAFGVLMGHFFTWHQ